MSLHPAPRRGPVRPLVVLALAVGVLAASAARPLAAQTITFPPSDFPAGSSTPIPNGYGATPGVATTYRSLTAFGNTPVIGGMSWWDTGHGGVSGVAYGVQRTGSVAEVGLVNFGAGPLTLSDFQIGSWQSRSRTLFLQVLDVNYRPLYIIQAALGATPFSFADYLVSVGAPAPTSTTGFRIQWTQDASPSDAAITGRGSYDASIDNIAFQSDAVNVVPEPATLALLGSGLAMLGGAAGRRTRRREAAAG